MLGCGEHYLLAFAIALGAPSFAVGILATFPLFVGALSQYLAIVFLDKPHPIKKTVVGCTSLQALSWLVILSALLVPPPWSPVALLLAYSLYHFFGNFNQPVWNAWMGELVPSTSRGDYFGRRNRYKAMFQLLAFVVAGLILHYQPFAPSFARLPGPFAGPLTGFVVIFGIAMGFRIWSAYFQTRMDEVKLDYLQQSEHFSLWDFIRATPRSNFARYVIFVGLLLLATNIASPFFTIYQLRDLKFTYLEYMISLGVVFLFQFIAFQNWGRVADRFGNLRVTKVTAYLVSLLPLLWLLSTNYYYILFLQALSGIFWSGFNLCTVNFLFDAVAPEKRTRCVAYYNVIANGGILIGALLGGASTAHLPGTLTVFGWHLVWVSPLCTLFLVSSLLRFVVTWLIPRFIREVKEVEPASSWEVMRHMIGLSLSAEFATRHLNVFLGVFKKDGR